MITALTMLITPLSLATPAITIDVKDFQTEQYDHARQAAGIGSNVQVASLASSTINGTATHAYDGKPNDSDSDTDVDPYSG